MPNQVEKSWHGLSIAKIFALLKSGKSGLSGAEAKKRLKVFGFNKLPDAKPFSYWQLFFNQIKSPLVYILFFAAVVSLLLGNFQDFAVILLVVIANTILGFWQELKVNKSIQSIKKIIRYQARVWRDGREILTETEKLVPGDVIVLEAGDRVPADARLIKSETLSLIEAPLTGESAPSEKLTSALKEDAPLAERKNMVFMGTLVAAGSGLALVCATGAHTQIGKIAKLIRDLKDEQTPLQVGLYKFSHWLSLIIIFICVGIFLAGYLVGKNPLEMFMVATAIAVAAIPEGLLVAVTIILTIGMSFILKRQALVRKLIAAETLGSVSVICTDKTGTLTEGQMSVAKIVTADKEYEIDLKNDYTKLEKVQDLILKISVLCSSANIENPNDELAKMRIIGDPTEQALLLAAVQSGFNKDKLDNEYLKIASMPFDFQRKYMATLHEHKGANHQHVFIKGAPEKVMVFCSQVLIAGEKQPLTPKELSYLKEKTEQLSKRGLRILACAYKTGQFKSLENELNDLVFLGFVAIKDPLRPGTADSIKLCLNAGIRPIIITGDHKLTAKAIFAELGLATKGNIVEGKDLDKWSDAELAKKIKDIDIYARVEPIHKLRVVRAWQKRGAVVAMTGDGINDAPAMKAADIAVALGSGSDVAKETAEIILLDNNFSVIVAAVEQGRIIFDNIRKVVLYLLCDSFSEIILIAGSIIFGLPLPILVTQILWINLIADGPPNIAMAMEPGEAGIMAEGPRFKNESIINREMKILIFITGAITNIILFALFYTLLKYFSDISYIRTIIFATLGFDSLLYAFSVRSLRHSIFNQNPFRNKYLNLALLFSVALLVVVIYVPFLQNAFQTVALGWREWTWVLALGLIQVILIELVKQYYIYHQQNIKNKNVKSSVIKKAVS